MAYKKIKKIEMIEDISTKSKMQYGLQKRNCRLLEPSYRCEMEH